MTSLRGIVIISSLSLLLAGCSDDSSTAPDSQVPSPDGPALDAGDPDADKVEASTPDSGTPDAAADAAHMDTMAVDSAAPDGPAADSTTPDTASPDAAAADVYTGDMGSAAPPNKVAALNLVLWLTASTGVSRTANKVTGWKDQSGNGLDAAASVGYEPTYVASVAALNNQPALQMSTSYLSAGSSTKFNIATPSMFVVTAGVVGGISVTKSFGSSGKTWRKLELNKKTFRSGADSDAIAHNAVAANSNILSLVSTSNTSHTISVNGAAITSTSGLYHTSYNSADFKIGGSKAGVSSLNGQLAEIILYDTALSASDRKLIECYLAAKYAITTVGCP